MAKVGLFTEAGARAVAAHVRKFGRKTPALNRRETATENTFHRRMVMFKAPVGGIPAAAGTTLGSAMCTVLKRVDADIVELNEQIKVYNWVDAVVNEKGKRWGVAHFDRFGDWYVSAEDCNQV